MVEGGRRVPTVLRSRLGKSVARVSLNQRGDTDYSELQIQLSGKKKKRQKKGDMAFC